VVLTTPSGLHPQQAIEAAQAGFDVMTEKPMATRWSDGLAMVRGLRRSRRALFVVKQNRRNPRCSCSSGRRAGASAASTWSTSTSSGPGPQATTTAPWRGTWEFDGGAFMNQASHYVDLLDWLIGPVEA
jgi:UDP-N-acetyl-2-amino-2-deoxyglucuronate dehydrogenase